jgi:hypothetical protein
MTSTSRIGPVVVSLVVAASLSGCAGTGPPARPGSASSPAAAPCIEVAHALTETDNGQRFCVPVGARIAVFLRGTTDDPWGTITSGDAVLRSVVDGHLALAVGVTGAYFLATAEGDAEVRSTRPCNTPSTAPAGCVAPQEYRIIVTIR